MQEFANQRQLEAYKSSPVFLQAAILFFLAVAIYANTLGFDYALDDTMFLKDNKYVTQGVDGIDDILSSDAMAGFLDEPDKLLAGGRYRPLSMIMFAVEYELWGKNPFYGHLVNLLLYGLLAVALFFLLRNVFKFQYQKPWYLTLPAIAVALYVVHPLHTEVVANIKGRDEILAMLFFVLTIHFIILYLDTRKLGYLLSSAPVFFLALISKENAVTALGVVPLIILVFRKEKIRSYLVAVSPLLLAGIAYAFLRYYALGFWTNEVEHEVILNNPFIHANGEQRFATVLYTWAIYLKLLFYPHPLTHDYYPFHIELVDFSNPIALFSLIFWSAALIFALIRIWKKDVVAFSILFFLITFLPSSNLLFNVGTFMNERFVFIPSLAAAIFLAWIFNQLLRRMIRNRLLYKRITIFIVIAVLLAGSAKSVVRNTAWKNDLTLFITDVKISESSAKVNTSAGGKLLEASHLQENEAKRDSMLLESEKYLKRALNLLPGNLNAANLLGKNYLERKMYNEAYQMFDYILKIRKDHGDAYHNIHALIQRARVAGRFELAKDAAFRLLKIKPNDLNIRFELAMIYLDMDKPVKSMEHLQIIINKDPTYAEAYSEIGGIYGRYLNDYSAAKQYLLKAMELDAQNYNTIQNLGIIFAQEGDYQRAIHFFKKAVELEPKSENAYRNLAMVYKQSGNQKMYEQYIKMIQELRTK